MTQPPESERNHKTVGVIGGGLAGTFLTIRCLEAGFKVFWWNHLPEMASSLAAAGLFNIYSGRNLTQTWNGLALREALHEFFDSPIGEKFQDTLHLMPLYRPFTFEETQLYYYPPKESSVLNLQFEPVSIVNNSHGGMWIHGVGWLDVPAFLYSARKVLPAIYPDLIPVSGFFNSGKVNLEERTFNYQGNLLQYDDLFFCEGLWAEENPLWRPYIYLTHLKGQLIKIKTDFTYPNIVVNQQAFMIPHDNGIWTVGATYEHRYDDYQPTEEAKNKLLQAFYDAFSLGSDARIEVISHWTGIRPTTPDQKPIIGKHPLYSNLWILNGLGTKGVLYACYGSKLLVQAVLDASTSVLPEELRPARWKKKKKYE